MAVHTGPDCSAADTIVWHNINVTSRAYYEMDPASVSGRSRYLDRLSIQPQAYLQVRCVVSCLVLLVLVIEPVLAYEPARFAYLHSTRHRADAPIRANYDCRQIL